MENEQMGNEIFHDSSSGLSSDSKAQAKPFLSFSILDGFKCFFKQSVDRQQLSYHECYQKVMKSHFQLQKIRLPTQKLFKLKDLSMSDRSRQLYYRSTPSERFYIQSGDQSIFKYTLGKDKEEQIVQLQRQLQLYRRSGEEALLQKRRQLKQVREEQERIRERQQEQKHRRQRVLQKLKIQREEQRQQSNL